MWLRGLVCRVVPASRTRVHAATRKPSPMTSPDPLARLTVGMRAVVRHRVDGGLSDALGQVVALDADTITVETRRGPQVIARSDVTLAKEVPPHASRRGAPHRAISVDDLQLAMEIARCGAPRREARGGTS